MNYAGIDLGTHTTQIGVVDATGQPTVLSTQSGEQFFRSAVFFEEDGSKIVGIDAENAGLVQPKRLVTNWKRAMGTDTVLYRAEDGTEYRAVDIASVLLEECKRVYEQKTGCILTSVAVAIPANYTDVQREHTKQAVESVDLELVCLRHEPTCAAVGNQVTKRRTEKVAIIDLGGGTFDVSILSVKGNQIDVLVTNGISKLGGTDYSKRLLDSVLADFEKLNGFRPSPDRHPIESQNLISNIEQLKRTLSVRDSAPVAFSCDGKAYSRKVTRSDLARITSDLTERAMEKTKETLAEAGMQAGDIDEFIPVGGGSLVPSFLEAIEKTFKKAPSQHCNPHFSVALGITEAGLIQKQEEDGEVVVCGRRLPSRETFLSDVTPHPFGVCVSDEMGSLVNEVILRKGVKIPSRHIGRFQLERPNQTGAQIRILQGKNNAALESCLTIGEFFLEDLTPVSDRPHEIEIKLEIGRDGMLAAQAQSLADGTKADLTVTYESNTKGE